MMPKSKGNAYFIACKKGADEAAAELGIDFIWDGPTSKEEAPPPPPPLPLHDGVKEILQALVTDVLTSPELKNLREFYRMAVPADSIARAIAYAIEQPDEVEIDEIVVRPTAQDF